MTEIEMLKKAVAQNRKLAGLPPQPETVAQEIIEYIWGVWYGLHRGVMNSDQFSDMLNEAKRKIIKALQNENPNRM